MFCVIVGWKGLIVARLSRVSSGPSGGSSKNTLLSSYQQQLVDQCCFVSFCYLRSIHNLCYLIMDDLIFIKGQITASFKCMRLSLSLHMKQVGGI